MPSKKSRSKKRKRSTKRSTKKKSGTKKSNTDFMDEVARDFKRQRQITSREAKKVMKDIQKYSDKDMDKVLGSLYKDLLKGTKTLFNTIDKSLVDLAKDTNKLSARVKRSTASRRKRRAIQRIKRSRRR